MKLAALLRCVDRFFEAAIVLIFAALVVVGGMQVFNRFVLNASLSWSEEFQKFAHIWLVYFAIPVAYKRGSHIGVELVVNVMPPRLRWLILLVTDLLWLGIGCAVVFYTHTVMQVARFQTSPGLGITFDYAYLGLVIGSSYLIFVVLHHLLLHVKAGFSGLKEERP